MVSLKDDEFLFLCCYGCVIWLNCLCWCPGDCSVSVPDSLLALQLWNTGLDGTIAPLFPLVELYVRCLLWLCMVQSPWNDSTSYDVILYHRKNIWHIKCFPACVWFCVLRELSPRPQQERSKPRFLVTVLLSEAEAIGRASSHVSFEAAQILANVSFKDLLALSTWPWNCGWYTDPYLCCNPICFSTSQFFIF